MSDIRLPFPFHIMVKPHGPVCNLACRYCFYLHKKDMLDTASKWRMTGEILEEFTRGYIEAQPEGASVNFAWQGGEPTLMGLDFFKKAVEFQEKYSQHGVDISNSFQTNATLIDEEWASFFSEHNFLIGVSIDGPKSIHNCYRVTRSGEGTFDRIMQSVQVMKEHNVDFNALTCVTNMSRPNALEIYGFLREHFDFIQFIPIVEEKRFTEEAPFLEHSDKWDRTNKTKPADLVHSWSVSGEDYGEFLCTVFDEWVRHDVGKTFVQIFDVTLSRWAGQPASLCIFTPMCGKALALEHDGTLYTCDHFVYPEYRIGNIMETPIHELVNSPEQRKFGEDKYNRLPEKCLQCTYGGLCAGACPKDRFITAPDGETELNFLCEGYCRFFKHTEHCMKDMVRLLRQRRPAADIMDMYKTEKSGPPGPNGPCPCGSGKKYKNCCMHG